MTETPPPPYEQQQPAPGQQAPGTYYQQPVAEDPGKTLGIVGLILSFFTALIGLIVSAIALNKSKKAGFKNTPALVGIIIGAIGTVFAVIAISLAIAAVVAAGQKCAELGPGVHQEGGVTITCGG
jgi:hypothetical protein